MVPEFAYLNGELLYAAATEGVQHAGIKAYLDSLLQFAIGDQAEGAAYLEKLRATVQTNNPDRAYQTTEAQILEQFAPATAELTKEAGLSIVRTACDQLEAEVDAFLHQSLLAMFE